MDFKPRIIDDLLDLRLESFGAALIVGPKGCGKTTSAKQKAKSFIEFQNEDVRQNLLAVAAEAPSKLLNGDKPRLFDEWQDAPKLWGAIRKSVDDLNENGLYILTGSSSKDIATPRTGTSRISRLKMYPMSLSKAANPTARCPYWIFLATKTPLMAANQAFRSMALYSPYAAGDGLEAL